MKKLLKILGIAALMAAVMGFGFVGCSDDDSGDSGPVAVTGVSLDKGTAEIEVDGTVRLTPIFTPGNATNKKVTWESSAPTVAGVSTSGVVTGKSVGPATITVKTEDGNKEAVCEVTVVAAGSFVKVTIMNGATKLVEGDVVKGKAYTLGELVDKFGEVINTIYDVCSDEELTTSIVDVNGGDVTITLVPDSYTETTRTLYAAVIPTLAEVNAKLNGIEVDSDGKITIGSDEYTDIDEFMDADEVYGEVLAIEMAMDELEDEPTKADIERIFAGYPNIITLLVKGWGLDVTPPGPSVTVDAVWDFTGNKRHLDGTTVVNEDATDVDGITATKGGATYTTDVVLTPKSGSGATLTVNNGSGGLKCEWNGGLQTSTGKKELDFATLHVDGPCSVVVKYKGASGSNLGDNKMNSWSIDNTNIFKVETGSYNNAEQETDPFVFTAAGDHKITATGVVFLNVTCTPAN